MRFPHLAREKVENKKKNKRKNEQNDNESSNNNFGAKVIIKLLRVMRRDICTIEFMENEFVDRVYCWKIFKERKIKF